MTLEAMSPETTTPETMPRESIPVAEACRERANWRSSRGVAGAGCVLLAATLLLNGPVLSAEDCAPPTAMRARLMGEPDAATLKDLGMWFAQREHYECATQAFASSLQLDPKQPDLDYLAFMFGVSLFSSGHVQDSIAALQHAEQLGINDIKLHIVLAAALDSTHAQNDAEAEWRLANFLDPENSKALDSLSSDLLLDRDYAGVIALLDVPRLLAQRTDLQTLNLGSAYARSGNTGEDVALLRDGLNTNPDSSEIAHALVAMLIELDRTDDAAAALQVELAHHPDNLADDLETEIGLLEALLPHHPERTGVAGREFLKANPHNARLLYFTGVSELLGRDLEPARVHLEEAVSLNPEEALAQEALGDVLLLQQEFPQAKLHLERALALGDNNLELRENLRRVSQALAGR